MSQVALADRLGIAFEDVDIVHGDTGKIAFGMGTYGSRSIAVGGAALVLVADSLCRLAPGAGEVRLGVAMALIGAPFFLGLLLRHRGRAWI